MIKRQQREALAKHLNGFPLSTYKQGESENENA
jgi:hypothetical protein